MAVFPELNRLLRGKWVVLHPRAGVKLHQSPWDVDGTGLSIDDGELPATRPAAPRHERVMPGEIWPVRRPVPDGRAKQFSSRANDLRRSRCALERRRRGVVFKPRPPLRLPLSSHNSQKYDMSES